MDRFTIEINQNKELLRFEVVDYAHDHDETYRCKFELFKDNKLVAGFEPDAQGYLNICRNPGNIDEQTLHLVAEKLESHHF